MIDSSLRVPSYINKIFGFIRTPGLPSGVYQVEDIYYPVAFCGSHWTPEFRNPCDNHSDAHKLFQQLYVMQMRKCLSHYSLDELYNQDLAMYLRLIIEMVERDIENNRETTLNGQNEE